MRRCTGYPRSRRSTHAAIDEAFAGALVTACFAFRCTKNAFAFDPGQRSACPRTAGAR